MVKDWGKRSPFAFENQKGKIFRYDRMTETANLIRLAKLNKFPAPTSYTPKRQNKNPIIGPMHYSSAQMQMVPNMIWKGKQTPGFCYNITKVVSILLSYLTTPLLVLELNKATQPCYEVLSTR